MRRVKKAVALILCVAIISSLCAFQMMISVSAEETASVVEITEQDVLLIEKLESFGIISNEYDPSSYVSRREMAKIIAQYISLPTKGTAKTSPFYDVAKDDEAIGAISGLYNMGVITGDENHKFHPDNNVTYDEALVFIINAVGHKIFAQRSGGYPTGYHRIAIKLDMLDDVSMLSGKADATVIDIYKMLDGALTAASVETLYYGDGDVQYTLSATETFLSENYGIKKYRGKVTGNECTKLTSYSSNLSDEQIEIDGVIYDTPGYIYGYFLGYTVDYYVKEDSSSNLWELMYVEEAPKMNERIRLDEDDDLRAVDNAVYYRNESDKEKSLPLINNVDVIYNNQSYVGYGTLANIIPQQGYIEVLDNDANGVYDVLFVYEYKNIIVDATDTYTETVFYTATIIDEGTGTPVETACSISLDSEEYKVTIMSSDGKKAMKFSNIQRENVLSVLESKSVDKVISVYISNNILNGKIEGHNSVDGFLIGEKYYKLASDYSGDTISVGSEGLFYLDLNERIVKYEYNSSGAMTGLAVMAGVEYKLTGLNKELSVRIFTDKGVFLEAQLSKNVKIDNVRYDLETEQGVINALKKLTNNYINAGKYEVYNTYLLKYALSSDKEITAIDMGGIGGKGSINSMIPVAYNSTIANTDYLHVGCDDYMLVRDNYVLVMNQNEEANWIYARYQASTGVIFATPDAGELSEDNEYRIIDSLKRQRYYGQTGTSLAVHTDVLTNYSAYTFSESDSNIVDAFVFRGLDRASSSGSGGNLRVVTEITQAADSDGMQAYKLYEGTNEIGLLDDVIELYKIDGATYENITVTSLFADASKRIKEGMVISVSENSDGKISSIEVVAEYDSANEVLKSRFMAGGISILNPNVIGNSGTNYIVGEFVAADTTNKIITIKVTYGGAEKEYILNNEGNVTPKLYRESNQSIGSTELSSLYSGDQIMVRTSGYCNLAQIIVFR